MRHQMTWLTLAAMMLCHVQAQAKDWYVSSSSSVAADTNAGTNIRPFKTLSRLTTLGKLASGDTINLACGDTWRETLSLNSNNSAGNLTIQSWPTTCPNRPIINASVLLPAITWQAVSGKPYYSYKLTTAEAAQITGNVEFVRNPANDATAYFKARYPDPASSGNNYALADGVDVGSGLLTMKSSDASLVASNDMTGADIHMRNQLWYVTSGTVTGQSGSTLTVQGVPTTFAANDGYVLENKLWMLNKPGEWYFDKTTKTLYAASVSGTSVAPPTKLELTVRNNALSIRDIPGIKIVNLNVLSTVGQAIDVRNSLTPTIQNNLVQYGAMGVGGACGDNAAIFVGSTLDTNCNSTSTTGSNGAIILGNNVQKSGYAGINVMSDSALIQLNTIDKTGTISRTRNVMYALYAAAPGGTISGNTVTNSAYMGIAFSNKSKAIGGVQAAETVKDNTVNKFCLFYADCGGIYTYNGNGDADQATPLTQGPSTVSNNAVYDAVGDYQGSHNTDRHLTVGVYLDNFTANVSVKNNVLAKLGTGILMNSGSGNTIDGNVVHAATGQGLLANDGGTGGRLKNNTVQNNVFHTLRRYVLQAGTPPSFQAGVAQNWYQPSNPALLFTTQGNIVKNNVAVDAGGKPAQWRLRQNSTWPYSSDVSLGKWVQLAQSGQTSPDTIKAPFRPKLVNLTGLTGTNLIANGDFSAGLTSWEVNGADLPSTSVIDPQITNGCVGPCVKFVQNTGSPIQSNTFSLDSTGLYYFEYVAMGQMGSKSDAIIFNSSYGANGYQSDLDASNELGAPANGYEARWTERFFTPTSTDSSSRFAVYSNAGKATYIDQVKLFKITSPLAASNLYNPTQYTAILYNNSVPATNLSFSCPFTSGCTGAVNHEGTALTFPVTVASGGRVLVYLKPSAWAR
jgi:parallel beta-helix repeat protein